MDHLQLLECTFGVTDLPLKWFKSYLTSKSLFITTQPSVSAFFVKLVRYVPQVSILGSLLLVLNIAELHNLAAAMEVLLHAFADNSSAVAIL